jgi:hypothetical protein
MIKEASLHKPQIEFVKCFLKPEQLQRMLIYFSKQKPTDSNAQHGFADVVVRLINEPLSIIFGEHGVYFFSNFLLTYPYNELDSSQLAYITRFLGMHVADLPTIEIGSNGEQLQDGNESVPSIKIDARVTKQMGGGYTVRPVQLTNIRIDTFEVLAALVRGIMNGSQKHDLKYRQHAVNLQLQRILTRIVVSRAQLQAVNVEIENCMTKQSQMQGGATAKVAMMECA